LKPGFLFNCRIWYIGIVTPVFSVDNIQIWTKAVFLKRFFPGGTPKIIVHIQRNPFQWKRKTKNYKYAVVGALTLLRYFQLLDKNSRDISRYIYDFLRYFRIVLCLFHSFCRNPKRCSGKPTVQRDGIWTYDCNVQVDVELAPLNSVTDWVDGITWVSEFPNRVRWITLLVAKQRQPQDVAPSRRSEIIPSICKRKGWNFLCLQAVWFSQHVEAPQWCLPTVRKS
jgi:hypothetical protein